MTHGCIWGPTDSTQQPVSLTRLPSTRGGRPVSRAPPPCAGLRPTCLLHSPPPPASAVLGRPPALLAGSSEAPTWFSSSAVEQEGSSLNGRQVRRRIQDAGGQAKGALVHTFARFNLKPGFSLREAAAPLAPHCFTYRHRNKRIFFLLC